MVAPALIALPGATTTEAVVSLVTVAITKYAEPINTLSPTCSLFTLPSAPVEKLVPLPVITPFVPTATVPAKAVVATAFVNSLRKYVPTPVIVALPLVTETVPAVFPLTVIETVPDNVVLITVTVLAIVMSGLNPTVTTNAVSDVTD